MKVALVIGHRPLDPGAVNEDHGITEFEFNKVLAEHVYMLLTERGLHTQIVYRQDLQTLPRRLNDEIMPDFIVSLHCNAYPERPGEREATGTEVLYYRTSERGKEMAAIMQRKLVKALLLRDRGIQPKRSEDRGGYLLRYTQAPCIICEPFFLDNDNDLAVTRKNYDALVSAYVDGIEEIAGVMHG